MKRFIRTCSLALMMLCLQAFCIAEVPSGIICWGDSLTQGAGGNGATWPQALQDAIRSKLQMDIPVVNMGVGGEDTYTILGRSGVVPFVTGADFTIPSSAKKSVSITMESGAGALVTPLRQGKAGMETVWIGGVKGRIRVHQASPYEGDFSYSFVRSSKGKKTFVPAGTEIITAGSQSYTDYLPVIFMGQNGHYSDVQDLIRQHRMLIDRHSDGRFLVIGISSGNAAGNAEMEKAMEEAFGRQYINLRDYMCTRAMADAGLEATEADLARMAEGSTPLSLHASPEDTIHFNATGYELIGKLVYARMDELGYFN